MDNKIENSFQTDVNQNIHTQRHYLYGQATTQIHDLWIQISAAGTYDVRFGDDGFNNLRFTPNVTLGYNINDDNELRFNYSSYTGIPDIQQTSESKVLVMNGIFRSGNPGLIHSHSHNLAFMY